LLCENRRTQGRIGEVGLSLYINFVNLFQFLMMFLGQRR